MRLPLFFAAMVLAGGAHAMPPQRVVMQYEMSRNGTAMVEVTETLEHDGRNYRISSEARGKGLFALAERGTARRMSRGVIDAHGLKPVEFRDRRGNGPEAVAHFDWSKKTLAQEFEGRNETLPLAGPAQDRLSFLYWFAFAPPAKDIDVLIADGRGTTRFRYKAAGRETLKTPAGDIEALHLVKQRDGPEDRATDLWLASGRHFLPVRILVTEKDGTRIDQVVTRIGN